MAHSPAASPDSSALEIPAPDAGLPAPNESPVNSTPGRHGGHAVKPIGKRHARTLLFFFSSSIGGSSHSGGSVRRNWPRNWGALIDFQFLYLLTNPIPILKRPFPIGISYT